METIWTDFYIFNLLFLLVQRARITARSATLQEVEVVTGVNARLRIEILVRHASPVSKICVASQ